MKNSILILLINLLSISIVFSQVRRTPVEYNDKYLDTIREENSGSYIGVSISSQMPYSTNGEYVNNYNLSSSVLFKKDVSVGKGIDFSVCWGTKISSNLGFELGVSYLIGNSTTIKYTHIDSLRNLSATESYYGSFVRFSPALVFENPINDWAIYGKIGLNTGIASKKTVVENVYNQSSSNYLVQNYEVRESGGVPFGFLASIGFKKYMSTNRFFFSEIGLNQIRQKYKQADITQYSENGVDLLSILKINEKQYSYVDELNSTMNTNKDEPTKLLSYWSNLSTISFRIGFIFIVGK